MKQNDWADLLFSTPVPSNIRQPNGIRFDDVLFTEPTSFRSSPPLPPWGGIYVIMVPDLNSHPRTYRAIYFGQARDLSQRVCDSHENYEDWVTEAEGAHRLYVSFHTMGGTEQQRVAVERRLIQKYQPACNTTFNPANALYARLYRK